MGLWRFGVSCPKIPPRNLPNIYFLTAWKHWLGIAKPKNVFGSTLNLYINLLCKNFLFNRFFCWLTDWLSDYLMLSDKRNSITAKAMGLISSLFNVTLSRDMPRCSSNAHIMVLPKLTFVLLYSPFSFPLPHRWRFAVALLLGFMKDIATSVIAEVFNTLPFCLNHSVKC